MCDFHSIIGFSLGEDHFEVRHTPDNSHATMRAGVENKPNSKTVVFEAEWNLEGEQPAPTKLIRNIGECPERLVKMITRHYAAAQKAVTTGEGLNQKGIFSDQRKWTDLYQAAMRRGSPVELVGEFPGDVIVAHGGTLNVPALTKAGYVIVEQGGTLNVPALESVAGYVIVAQGGTLNVPALESVAGYVIVEQGGTLNVPALESVAGYVRVEQGGTLNAPKLKR